MRKKRESFMKKKMILYGALVALFGLSSSLVADVEDIGRLASALSLIKRAPAVVKDSKNVLTNDKKDKLQSSSNDIIDNWNNLSNTQQATLAKDDDLLDNFIVAGQKGDSDLKQFIKDKLGGVKLDTDVEDTEATEDLSDDQKEKLNTDHVKEAWNDLLTEDERKELGKDTKKYDDFVSAAENGNKTATQKWINDNLRIVKDPGNVLSTNQKNNCSPSPIWFAKAGTTYQILSKQPWQKMMIFWITLL